MAEWLDRLKQYLKENPSYGSDVPAGILPKNKYCRGKKLRYATEYGVNVIGVEKKKESFLFRWR